ncbi:MAG: hypothetical protein IPK76_01750 [Lewinellaceae bacterium]|nr:hypothetical protein [Lewinellaceae bacterium]
MAKRIITKIGDVFCLNVSEGVQRYFQYVANDMTQLNSSVIRVFKKNYPAGQTINFDEIVSDEVDFYAHCVLAWGIQFGHWQKAGKSQNIGTVEAWFRDTEDYGSPEITVSNHFYPFGLDLAGPWMNDAAQDNLYKYNGKELNSDFGLNWMDYRARWYT